MPSSEPSTVPQGWFHRCWSSAARPVLGAKPHSVYCICISPTHKVSVQAKTLEQSFPHGTSSPEPFLPLNHHGLQLSLVWCCLSSLQIHERKWPEHLQQSAATQPHLSSLLKLSPPHPLPIPSFSLQPGHRKSQLCPSALPAFLYQKLLVAQWKGRSRGSDPDEGQTGSLLHTSLTGLPINYAVSLVFVGHFS